MERATDNHTNLDKQQFVSEIIKDFTTAVESRQASLLGRKLVLTGKAKFGIFGDGKEVAQLAMARVFNPGDWRSGYYRDQTFMFATGMSNIAQFFSQLYANPSVENEPASAGRLMNGHFATRFLDDNGDFTNQTTTKNSSSDISPTAGQMPRLLGLALASKLYRNNPDLHAFTQHSLKGNEIAFGTIGNASTSEGHFWETINAACVLQVPMLMSVWDDEYGISVHAKYQTAKESISDALAGFEATETTPGLTIFKVKAHDYSELCRVYKYASDICRTFHKPVLIHVIEVTQPQGHSTSGSHERYKSEERLQWEKENDCILKMRNWIIEKSIATNDELEEIEKTAIETVKEANNLAFNAYQNPIKEWALKLTTCISNINPALPNTPSLLTKLNNTDCIRKDIAEVLHEIQLLCVQQKQPLSSSIIDFKTAFALENTDLYSSHLHSQSNKNALKIPVIPAQYSGEMVDGYQVVRACFQNALKTNPLVFAFGEDVGKIGDVNQGFSGLQEEFGELRVTDKGIRELTIVGEAIGAALRGLRPIAEIQYLDYLLYAIQILSDDVATLQYRTKGGQKAPLIIRTRGHRLEGVWHSGSPMGMIINALRGMYVCVPRNMTQAAGMYNTLLQSDEPAIVIECLNGYRLKEEMPTNIGTFTVPLGIAEVLQPGTDITLVTYGSCCRIAQAAALKLATFNISVEIIDVQTLLPFDTTSIISQSVKKTSRILFLDEDVPGGAAAYMYQQVMENQSIFNWLDSAPITLTAKAHRPAYSTDGDYFSKPNVQDVFNAIYDCMHEVDPASYPNLI